MMSKITVFGLTIHQKLNDKVNELRNNKKIGHFTMKVSKKRPVFQKPPAYMLKLTISPVYATKTTYLKLDTCPKSVKKVSKNSFTPVQFCPVFFDT